MKKTGKNKKKKDQLFYDYKPCKISTIKYIYIYIYYALLLLEFYCSLLYKNINLLTLYIETSSRKKEEKTKLKV